MLSVCSATTNKPSTHELHVSMNRAQNLNLGLLRLTLTLECATTPPPTKKNATKFWDSRKVSKLKFINVWCYFSSQGLPHSLSSFFSLKKSKEKSLDCKSRRLAINSNFSHPSLLQILQLSKQNSPQVPNYPLNKNNHEKIQKLRKG